MRKQEFWRAGTGQVARRLTAYPPAEISLSARSLGRRSTKAALLGKRGALTRVGRRDHRIVVRQIPFPAIFFGRHAVVRLQVPLQHRELLAIFEADDELVANGFLDWHRRLDAANWLLKVAARQVHQGAVHASDEARYVGRSDVIAAQVGCRDVRSAA